MRFSSQIVDGALDSLKNSLAGSGGMAGSDNTGQEFSGGYDQGAQDIAGGLAGLVDMAVNAADLIRASGLNHQAAQRASTAGGPPPTSASIPETPATAVPTFPSAYGGGGSEPTGAIATAWYYIEQWVGYVWPNGSPERLEAAAQAWTTAFNSIKSGDTSIEWATNDLAGQQSPEIPAATAHLNDLKGKLNKAGEACLQMATSCNNLAQAIKDAHQQLIDELAQFAAEFVVGEIVFGVLFEVGGELWGNAAMVARGMAIAQRCARIIEKLIELARAAARIAKAASEIIADVVKNIKGVVAALVTRSNIDRNAAALVKYTEQALKDFDSGLIGFSRPQAEAIRNNPSMYNMFKGNVLDARVKDLVNHDPGLNDLTTTGNFQYGPDFVNTFRKAGQEPWYDLTTMKQWAAHAKYDATHGGPGGGILWDVPGGVTYVPPG
jgi:hypothetical protein